MAVGAKGDEVVELVRLLARREGAKWSLVVHVVSFAVFRGATALAAIAVARTDAVTDRLPIRSIVVRIIGPKALRA